jgi:7-cyano-7-deazaguanine reductase
MTQVNPLGQLSPIPATYAPTLLYPIPRRQNRQRLKIVGPIPFAGLDRWDCFEVSWLAANGMPQSAFAVIQYPADSVAMVESKSLKLYLMGFHQTRYASAAALTETLVHDLTTLLGSDAVQCTLMPFEQMAAPTAFTTLGHPLDELAQAMPLASEPNAALLRCAAADPVEEQLYSNRFRSVCPVTGQPDWATVVLRYCGSRIDRAALLVYLSAYRQHSGYHEDCCERIFLDILTACQPSALVVGCFFARRGGIAISPVRWLPSMATPQDILSLRLARQ